jgi:hypothetical protein
MTALCALFLIVASGFSPATQQFSKDQTLPVTRFAPDLDSTFSVQNLESVNVGWVNIHLSNNTYAYLNITGQGTFSSQALSYAPYECTIHGQTFGMNTPTWIMIDLHTAVLVTWIGNVIRIDQTETN